MILQRCIATGLSAAALAYPAASMAAPPGQQEYPDHCGCQRPAEQQETQAQAEHGFGAAAPAARLEQTRGGDGAIDTRLSGTVTGNSAGNVTTGANIIQSGSFANAAGVPVVIQNSGANVLIQNATVINLQLK